MTDIEQLHLYTRSRRGEDLTPLIEQHLNWVYSCARRQVHGDEHLAADVTQAVFLVLAQRPPVLRDEGVLGGWLFRVTRYAACRAVRSEIRRRHHEGKAAMLRRESIEPAKLTQQQWDEIAPMLDELVAKLPEPDRRSVLLRFFQQKSFVEVGTSLGISEEAARKRVTRAVDRLRTMFASRGVAAPSAALAGGMLSLATKPAPATVIPMISSTPAASVAGLSKGVSLMMSLAKVKLIAAIVLIALLPAAVVALVAQENRQQAPVSRTAPPASQPATSPTVSDAIEVRAIDSRGQPVGGAEVYVLQQIHSINGLITSSFTAGPEKTDDNGTIRIVSLPPINAGDLANQIFYARLPGQRVGLVLHRLGPNEAPVPKFFSMTLMDATAFSGKVNVPQGFQFQGLNVKTLWIRLPLDEFNPMQTWYSDYFSPLDQKWPGMFSAAVQPDGTFTMTDVPAQCDLAIAIEGPGLGQSQVAIARSVQQSAQINMKPQAVVSGSLTYAETSKPGTGLIIKLFPAKTVNLQLFAPISAKTDDQGHFRFEGLAEGIYSLVAIDVEGWTMPVRQGLRVTPGQTLDHVDVGLERGTVITGQVKGAGDGKAVAGAMIGGVNPADPGSEIIAQATTDQNGQFSMRLPTGSSMLYVMYAGKGYAEPRRQGQRTVTIDGGKVEGDLAFAVPRDTSTSFSLATINGQVLDGDGKPVAKVSIGDEHSERSSGDSMSLFNPKAAITDEEGKFSMRVQAGISHSLSVSAPDYSSKAEAVVPKTDEVVSINIVATPQPVISYISGTVVDPDGHPLEGAEIPYSDSTKIMTDAQGHFRVPLRKMGATHLGMGKVGFEYRDFSDIPAGSEGLKFVLYPTSQANHRHANSPLPDSTVLLGQPAPVITTEAWAYLPDAKTTPQLGNGKVTLLMFTTPTRHDRENAGGAIERIERLQQMAAKMNAQAVVIFPPYAHESGLHVLLKDMKLTAFVGVDRYQVESVYQSDGVTRIVYGGDGQTRIFLIVGDGTIADDHVKLDQP